MTPPSHCGRKLSEAAYLSCLQVHAATFVRTLLTVQISESLVSVSVR